MFEIEKGIVMPSLSIGGGRAPKYPFRQMEIGDSFFIPNGTNKNMNFYKCAKQIGVKISMRRVEGGVRVWRIG